MVLAILFGDNVKPLTGKYFFNCFQYQEVRWVCMHAELLVQQQ